MSEKIDIRKQEFEKWEWNKPLICTTFYFVPLRKLHSSGYRRIKIVALKDGKYYEKTCCSDVINFNSLVGASGNLFNIDVDSSGLIQFFCRSSHTQFKLGTALSDFDVTIIPKEKTVKK